MIKLLFPQNELDDITIYDLTNTIVYNHLNILLENVYHLHKRDNCNAITTITFQSIEDYGNVYDILYGFQKLL